MSCYWWCVIFFGLCQLEPLVSGLGASSSRAAGDSILAKTVLPGPAWMPEWLAWIPESLAHLHGRNYRQALQKALAKSGVCRFGDATVAGTCWKFDLSNSSGCSTCCNVNLCLSCVLGKQLCFSDHWEAFFRAWLDFSPTDSCVLECVHA